MQKEIQTAPPRCNEAGRPDPHPVWPSLVRCTPAAADTMPTRVSAPYASATLSRPGLISHYPIVDLLQKRLFAVSALADGVITSAGAAAGNRERESSDTKRQLSSPSPQSCPSPDCQPLNFDGLCVFSGGSQGGFHEILFHKRFAGDFHRRQNLTIWPAIYPQHPNEGAERPASSRALLQPGGCSRIDGAQARAVRFLRFQLRSALAAN
jgi:hypothetical protein